MIDQISRSMFIIMNQPSPFDEPSSPCREGSIAHRFYSQFRKILLLCLMLFSCNELAAKTRKYPPAMPNSHEEVYKTVGDVSLKLWLFDPPGHVASDRRPAIVFFFGGGWIGGTPSQFEQQCRYLAEQGMVAITADYRVSSRHETLAIKCVEDGKSAIRWVRLNAKRLGIDPNRIVAAGGSAGGHVAACTGIVPGLDNANESIDVSSVPNALALFNPAMMLAPLEGIEFNNSRLAGIKNRTGIDPRRISPIHHIRADLPPTIIFHGDQDKMVPYESVRLYTKLANNDGNRCELATFDDYGHGFFNPGREGNPGEPYRLTLRQLHQFLKSLGYLDNDPAIAVPKSKNVHLRSHLDHSRTKFQNNKRGTVAFIGGSITEMGDHGHSGMVEKFLRKRFPDTKFEFVNAGISSTCSTTGAFRLTRDVLRHDPDMLFVEFAVNDDQDARHASRDSVRGMEGIIRQARAKNPRIDIVVTYFVNDSMLAMLQKGETPISSGAHERVARHYGIASIDLAKEVAERITAGTLSWKEYGGTHPVELGNRLAADLIEDLLVAAWKRPASEHPEHPMPRIIDRNSYVRGRLIDLEDAITDSLWTIGKPDWSNIPGNLRSRFAGDQLLVADEVGAEATLEFQGTAIGMYVLAGPDAGTVEYSIDGGSFRDADMYHHYSRGLHYPRTVMLDADLGPGKHKILVRVAASNNDNSNGRAIRILNFVVN